MVNSMEIISNFIGRICPYGGHSMELCHFYEYIHILILTMKCTRKCDRFHCPMQGDIERLTFMFDQNGLDIGLSNKHKLSI